MTSLNLIEAIQVNLGYAPLQKIDPNTQDVKNPENEIPGEYVAQSAIPTVLLGLYRYSRSLEGNTAILKHNNQPLVDTFFGDRSHNVVSQVAAYSGKGVEETKTEMEKIATEAVRIVRENLGHDASAEAVKSLLADQRHYILVYLPAGLQIGELLGDDTIDDRTHKMEGPMSGHMHWLEKLFSSSGPKETRGAAENW